MGAKIALENAVNVWNRNLTGTGLPPATSRGSRPAREKRIILYALSLSFDCASLVIGYVAASILRDATWLRTGGQPVIAIALPIFLMFEVAR